MHLLPNVGSVSADGQLNGSTEREPPPLHTKRHEAGAEDGHPHVHIQVRYVDVWLSGGGSGSKQSLIKLSGDIFLFIYQFTKFSFVREKCVLCSVLKLHFVLDSAENLFN